MAIIFIFSTEAQNCKASSATFCIIHGTKDRRTNLIPTTILADPKSFKDACPGFDYIWKKYNPIFLLPLYKIVCYLTKHCLPSLGHHVNWKYCPHHCYICMCCCWHINDYGDFYKVFINHHLPLKICICIILGMHRCGHVWEGRKKTKALFFFWVCFSAGLHRIPRTHWVWDSKKIFLQTCKKFTLYSDGIKSA